MNTYTTLGVMDQSAAFEALPPVPIGKRTDGPQRLRATGTEGPDAGSEQRQMVPTMVPSGAENGAKRPASDAREGAPNCTENATEEPSSAAVDGALNTYEDST